LLRKDWLRRELDTFDIYSLVHHDSQSTYYLMIGFIALYAAKYSFLISIYAVLIMIIIALVYGEMGSHFPVSGGSYVYVNYSLGKLIAFISVWLLALDQIIMIAYGTLDASNYLLTMISHIYSLHIDHKYLIVIALIISIILYILTLIGIRESANVAKIIAVIDIISIGILIIGFNMILLLLKGGFSTPPSFKWDRIDPVDMLIALALASRGFTGVDSIGQLAGEAKKPLTQIPRATFLLISIGSLFSISLMILLMNMVYYNDLTTDPSLAIYLLASETPYITSITVVLSTINIFMIMIMASLTGYVSFSRLLYILSQYKTLPSYLGSVHRIFRTPHIALTTAFIISLPLILIGEISVLLEVYAIGSLINYLMVSISLALLSRRGSLYGGFSTLRIKGIPITSVIGVPTLSTALIIVILVKYFFMWVIGLWLIAGLFLYYLQKLYLKRSL
jgi:APA family basic amino acid/polyamine antiporter